MRRAMMIGIIAMAFAELSCAREPAARTIGQIQFTGNARFSSSQLAEIVGIRVGDVNSTKAIDRAMQKIVAAYRAIDRDLALTVDVSPMNSSRARIEFVIDEDGSGGIRGATLRSGARMGGAPPPPPPASRQ